MNLSNFAQDTCLKARTAVALGELDLKGLQFSERTIHVPLPPVLLRHPQRVGFLLIRSSCRRACCTNEHQEQSKQQTCRPLAEAHALHCTQRLARKICELAPPVS